MSTSSIIVMITRYVIIWGGFTASITYAIRKNEKY